MYGIKLEPYKPTDEDLQFTANLVNVLKVGGKWGIPRCCIFYQKTGDMKMKLESYLIPALAKHMIDAGMVYQGMDVFKKVDELKQAQARDHHAFKACCKELGIEVDDSILDETGDR